MKKFTGIILMTLVCACGTNPDPYWEDFQLDTDTDSDSDTDTDSDSDTDTDTDTDTDSDGDTDTDTDTDSETDSELDAGPDSGSDGGPVYDCSVGACCEAGFFKAAGEPCVPEGFDVTDHCDLFDPITDCGLDDMVIQRFELTGDPDVVCGATIMKNYGTWECTGASATCEVSWESAWVYKGACEDDQIAYDVYMDPYVVVYEGEFPLSYLCGDCEHGCAETEYACNIGAVCDITEDCDLGETCCGDNMCSNLNSSIHHCGTCGNSCEAAESGNECIAGSCQCDGEICDTGECCRGENLGGPLESWSCEPC